MFKNFITKLGEKKLSEGVSRQDIELYRKGRELLDSKDSNSYDDIELFVKLVQKTNRKIIL